MATNAENKTGNKATNKANANKANANKANEIIATQEVQETQQVVETAKPKVEKQLVSKFAKFDHLANVIKIENTQAVKNYMLFALASRKSKVNFNEFAMETLYKYSMDPEFKAKVDAYI